MPVFTLGSINVDHRYSVPYLPRPGETLAADDLQTGLGGKGANQSVAAARAGASVVHMGAVGPDGDWALGQLAALGVASAHVARVAAPTGHAIICVDPAGENQIILYPGANRQIPADLLVALDSARGGDWLLLQNETNLQPEAAIRARAAGARVAYSAAPFDVAAVRAVLVHTDLLLLNAVEADQLCTALGTTLADLAVPQIVVTRGADGADWHADGQTVSVPAFCVPVIDTTGAGDTFAGTLVASMSLGLDTRESLRRASAAAALMVTRFGTANAIPTMAEVDRFLRG